MFGWKHIGIIAAVSVAGAGAAATPAEQWDIKVEPARCTLERAMAVPMPVTLMLRTTPGSDSASFALAGADVPRLGYKRAPITVAFQASGKRFVREGISFKGGDAIGEIVLLEGLKGDFLDAFASADSITLEAKAKALGPFLLPRAKGAIAAFVKCASDQLVEWGADAAQFEPGGKAAVELVPRDDWLTNAQMTRLGGKGEYQIDSTFRVGIAADGAIDSCAQIEGKLKPEKEKVACDAVLARRLFKPAVDPQGKPVRSVATFRVRMIALAEPVR